MPKRALRSELLSRRRAMGYGDWQSGSVAAQHRLIELGAFQHAACIALYSPIQQELDTSLIFEVAVAAGKTVLFPAVCGHYLKFKVVTGLDQLKKGSFGILEPGNLAKSYPVETADLIVVPGVAFDLEGHRIGFGKGYYDRCLNQHSLAGVVVGFCHDFQLLNRIPVEGHDIHMQCIVTDNRLIIPTGEKSRNRLESGLT